MDVLTESFIKNAPTVAALLFMTWLWMRRDESRDVRFERVAERSIEAEALTREVIRGLSEKSIQAQSDIAQAMIAMSHEMRELRALLTKMDAGQRGSPSD